MIPSRWFVLGGLACILASLAGPGTAEAFITRIYPLAEVMKESTHIVTGRIEQVDRAKRTAVAVIHRTLKGKGEFKRIQMNLGVGPAEHNAFLLDHMKVGAEVIIFYKRTGNQLASCAHTGGTWFQLFTNDNPKQRDKVWWRFTHVEIYMGRTFNGATKDLARLVANVLAGRARAPKPDKTVPKINVARRTPGRAGPKVAVAVPSGKSGGFRRQIRFPLSAKGEVRGASWVDVNGDERPDVYLCRGSGDVLLVNQGKGKSFQEMAAKLGLAGKARAAAWADYNGDDHPALLTNNFKLFTPAGGRLRDDSKLIRPPPRRNPEGAGWIDYNGDGRPDVLITNGEHGIRLYENTGKGPGWFRDVSAKAGLGPRGIGTGNGDFVAFLDYDGDGYTDFLYNFGQGVLAHNEGDGTFRRDTTTGIKLSGGSSYKRGVAVADYDNDGDLDLFIPGPKRSQLYRNNSDGTFTDVFGTCGDPTKEDHPSFAAAFGDVNCDGNLDLFVCHTSGSSRLYLGDGKGRFTDVSEQAGVNALSPAYGACFADADGDGDLDLAVNLADAAVVAINEMPRAKGFAPVTVRVRARRGLVGAVVRVLDAEGRPAGMRQFSGAGSYGGQAQPVANFALRPGVARVSVCLSDGRAAQQVVRVQAAKPLTVVFAEREFR